MSLTKNDRIFRSDSGKTLPKAGDELTPAAFATAVAAALREEFGDTPGAVKTVAKLVGGNERAVRNWFGGSNGPNGAHLVALMRHSPVVLEAVLALAHRSDLVQARLVADATQRVRVILQMLIALTNG